jgi:hypothetical protein
MEFRVILGDGEIRMYGGLTGGNQQILLES